MKLIVKDNVNCIVLRTAEIIDAQVLLSWWNDGKVMAHAGFTKGLNTSLDNVLKNICSNDEFRELLIIELNDNPIGEMSYTIASNVAEIGIKICDHAQQDNGIGFLAIRTLIEYLFDKKCSKIVLDTNILNKRAQHVYEKIGFKKVRIKENCFKNDLGVYQTAIDYELLKADYNRKELS